MPTLAAPKTVSPFIRFGRWSALITGIIYGSYRYSHLSKKEAEIQVVQNKIKAERSVQLAAEKAKFADAEMQVLGKEAGVVPI